MRQRSMFDFRYRLHLSKGGEERDVPLRGVMTAEGARNAGRALKYANDWVVVEDIHTNSIIATFGARKNPVPPSSRSDAQQRVMRGADLFERFSGHDAEEIGEIDNPRADVAVVFGELDAVLYTTVRDGVTEHYKHDFAKNCRPLLASSHDGSQLFILGGEYDFTERGIVDRE